MLGFYLEAQSRNLEERDQGRGKLSVPDQRSELSLPARKTSMALVWLRQSCCISPTRHVRPETSLKEIKNHEGETALRAILWIPPGKEKEEGSRVGYNTLVRIDIKEQPSF